MDKTHYLCTLNKAIYGVVTEDICSQDGSFTKAEIHGSDLWAYAGDDRGMIINNAVGKEIKWANADGKINVFKA